jgi:hypothetical protein
MSVHLLRLSEQLAALLRPGGMQLRVVGFGLFLHDSFVVAEIGRWRDGVAHDGQLGNDRYGVSLWSLSDSLGLGRYDLLVHFGAFGMPLKSLDLGIFLYDLILEHLKSLSELGKGLLVVINGAFGVFEVLQEMADFFVVENIRLLLVLAPFINFMGETIGLDLQRISF